jgi:lipopolysaccharide biosynthesis glycosyltransferase
MIEDSASEYEKAFADKSYALYPTEKEDVTESGISVDIFVSMHKLSFVPDSVACIKPIQVGAVLAEERFANMLRDDEGKNISDKNKKYCEMTAQYWAWKNVINTSSTKKYYGFWHYRRYFSFAPGASGENGEIYCKMLNDKALADNCIDDRHIKEACEVFDIIAPQPWNFLKGIGAPNVVLHWEAAFDREDLDLAFKIVIRKYPEMLDAVIDVMSAPELPLNNMYILRGDLCGEYFSFIFDILDEYERQYDLVKYESHNSERYRLIGHIAERMFGIWLAYIKNTRPDISIGYKPRLLIEDNRPWGMSVKPGFEITGGKEIITITATSYDEYMFVTGVLLQSIADNANPDYFYDIVLLHTGGLSDSAMDVCRGVYDKKDNILIRAADVSRNFAPYKNISVRGEFTVDTWYRLMLPDIFPQYDKVLYLDSDMVVLNDLTELWETDIGGYCAAAVRDLDFIANCHKNYEDYYEKILKHINIKNVNDYFQAGTILFNLAELRKHFTSAEIFKVAMSRVWHFQDQDVLNFILRGKVKYIGQRWNAFSLLEPASGRSGLMREWLPVPLLREYEQAAKNPSIIHFAGQPKVWMNLRIDLRQFYWKYARRSPYYEQIIDNFNTKGNVKTAWLVFNETVKGKHGVGVKFISIVNSGMSWNSVFAVLDFVFLTGGITVNDTLTVSLQLRPGEGNAIKVEDLHFKWEKGEQVFKTHIGCVVEDVKTLAIWCEPAGEFQGYSFTVRTLESRAIEKPKIVVHNSSMTGNITVLPQNLIKGN